MSVINYIIHPEILTSTLTPYVDKAIRDHQCGFRRNWSIADNTFCIHQLLKKPMIQLRGNYTTFSLNLVHKTR